VIVSKKGPNGSRVSLYHAPNGPNVNFLAAFRPDDILRCTHRECTNVAWRFWLICPQSCEVALHTLIPPLGIRENRHLHTSAEIAQYYLNCFCDKWRSIPRNPWMEGLRSKDGVLHSLELEGTIN